MICAHCGCFFCDDYALPAAPPKWYCSATCKSAVKRPDKRRRREARKRAMECNLRRSCERKIRHPDTDRAIAALREMHETGKIPLGAGSVYECPGCGQWHITSKAGWAINVTT